MDFEEKNEESDGATARVRIVTLAVGMKVLDCLQGGNREHKVAENMREDAIHGIKANGESGNQNRKTVKLEKIVREGSKQESEEARE
eukprot:6206009-Pleurochrysis_carterae.AAC.1